MFTNSFQCSLQHYFTNVAVLNEHVHLKHYSRIWRRYLVCAMIALTICWADCSGAWLYWISWRNRYNISADMQLCTKCRRPLSEITSRHNCSSVKIDTDTLHKFGQKRNGCKNTINYIISESTFSKYWNSIKLFHVESRTEGDVFQHMTRSKITVRTLELLKWFIILLFCIQFVRTVA